MNLPRLSRPIVWVAFMIALMCVVVGGDKAAGSDPSLLAHWPLSADFEDHSGGGQHLVNHGAILATIAHGDASVTAAHFDGRDDFLELPVGLRLGSDDFTIATWVHTDDKLTDVLGDIASQYDPASRRGFGLSLLCNHGVTSSQSNYRNVHFGIDAGSEPGEWTDHGRLGDAILIFSLAVHDGQLFAGTCVPEQDNAGRVFRYDGNVWVDCGAPDRANAVCSMAVYDGALYVGTGKYRLGGSSLTESENPHHGGGVFRYDGNGGWIDCGRLPDVESINGMVVFGGNLYATSMYRPAGFFQYEGGTTWTACETPDGRRTEALGVYNGDIYASGYDEGAVYRYDGERWSDLGVLDGATQTYGFSVHTGRLFVSEWPNARVYRLADEGYVSIESGSIKGDSTTNGSARSDSINWELAGRLGEERETMPLMVYNGKMYAGTLPSAEVYRYDGDTDWVNVARLDFTPDVRYRRVWSMAVYRGRLFAGTLPSGHVHSVEIGRNVTFDHALEPGWRHIAAVKDGTRLRLYIDGRLVGTSTDLNGGDYDLTNDKPLRVGFGANDYFNGRLRDLRVYRGALPATDVAALSRHE